MKLSELMEELFQECAPPNWKELQRDIFRHSPSKIERELRDFFKRTQPDRQWSETFAFLPVFGRLPLARRFVLIEKALDTAVSDRCCFERWLLKKTVARNLVFWLIPDSPYEVALKILATGFNHRVDICNPSQEQMEQNLRNIIELIRFSSR